MMARKKAMPWVSMVLLGLIGILFLSPLVWMAFSSLKTTTEVFSTNFHLLPKEPQWYNYRYVWQESEIRLMAGLILVFTLLRNLPAFAFLAP